MGVVFKSDKLSDSKLLLRVYAAENVNYVSDDKTINSSGIPWGIYPVPGDSNYLQYTLGQDVIDEIGTAVGVDDVCDIADLSNNGAHLQRL